MRIVGTVALVLVLGAGYLIWRFQRDTNRELTQAEGRLEQRLARATPRVPVFRRPAPRLHQVFARLEIPRVRITVPVVEGADDKGLKMGAAHILGTGYPGDAAANVGIAAHRDTWFRALSHIARGDKILLQTDAGVFRYQVGTTEIVAPTDTRVLQPDGRAEMTLVTCYPFYFVGHAPKRFIVHAALVRM